MSSERIGYNPNIGKLLEEICKNLSKIYLPEIVMYSLQCINYFLDLNPRLSNILRKNNIHKRFFSKQILRTLRTHDRHDKV